MTDKIARIIANILPKRIMYWAIIRAFARATTGKNREKIPDQTGFSAVIDEWK